ncbi:uncharacterized protein PHALS_07081 [Plasmopara halstedii]|uniref:Uncharacterized protein n=1 Tax=Plasmopara halstedii TaxID=4781 RepID=A0A0P1B5K9_PLAHL|nr:uncharacterized protein PHALS_07081 [Plasmopara halstedii]CEG49311.1 hypothetical protein PHALS_07081 [Plasmopara halstedii]|eukprot:XP_024585680.1 hypothetical protein PHALS_07081 [Plasmopara halstedii]
MKYITYWAQDFLLLRACLRWKRFFSYQITWLFEPLRIMRVTHAELNEDMRYFLDVNGHNYFSRSVPTSLPSPGDTRSSYLRTN